MHGNLIRMMVYIQHRNCNRRELQDHLYVLESGPVVDDDRNTGTFVSRYFVE